MTVIVINEECHGFIGLAKDYEWAVKFLIDNNWLDDYTEIFAGENEEGMGIYKRVIEELGENWADEMTVWGIRKFNDFWDGSFYLEEMEVYPTK